MLLVSYRNRVSQTAFGIAPAVAPGPLRRPDASAGRPLPFVVPAPLTMIRGARPSPANRCATALDRALAR